MATIEKKVTTGKQEFIGRAWLNVAGPETSHPGVQFLSLRIDRGITATLSEGDNIMLWPATKREGKQDADYRVSVAVPEVAG